MAIQPPIAKDRKVTTVAETTEDAKKAAIAARTADMTKREAELNKAKTGQGTRTFLSMTKGKRPQEIQYEQWNEELADTLPKTTDEFLILTGLDKLSAAELEKALVRRLILGDNEILYKEASDVTAEFVDASWPKEIQTGFKTVVKNYAANAGVSIEDAAALIKPGFVAAQEKAASSAK